MATEIRPARDEDAAGLVRAYEWLFAAPGSVPPAWDPERAREALAAAIASLDAQVLVALDGGEVADICTVYADLRSVRFGLRAWVEDLAVDPGRRSAGIGKALLDAAKAWGRERGCTHLELDSGVARTEAHRFYEREAPSTRSLCFGWAL